MVGLHLLISRIPPIQTQKRPPYSLLATTARSVNQVQPTGDVWKIVLCARRSQCLDRSPLWRKERIFALLKHAVSRHQGIRATPTLLYTPCVANTRAAAQCPTAQEVEEKTPATSDITGSAILLSCIVLRGCTHCTAQVPQPLCDWNETKLIY